MTAYTEITIQDQRVGLYFGLPAIAAIAKDIELIDGSNEIGLSLGSIVAVLHAGYENNCLIERKKPTLTNRDWYEFAEQAVWHGSIPEEIQDAINVFGRSKLVNQKAENGVLEEKKN